MDRAPQVALRYPIYIISKGRYRNPITARWFLKERIPFLIAVEPQEYESYCETIPREFVAKLPFSNLGLGSYPARNWCWEDSIAKGFRKHFIFDDNIYGFYRLNHGKRTRCTCLEALVAIQDFSERYMNLAIIGYNYSSFITKMTGKAFVINHHVYSGMLITNDIPFRWRMKYNEDVDLCLQALHAGWCTILVNVFSIMKVSTTEKLPGGNQTELYKGNDPKKKALKSRSLERIWPQYVKVVWRFGRPHHQVSWSKFFTQPLLKKPSEGV